MVRYERYIEEPELITAILDQCEIMSLGLMDLENAYVIPVNYGYRATKEKLYLYIHTGKTGYKLNLIEHNPRVCCSFYNWHNFPDHPYKGHVHDFMSVMAFGIIRKMDLEKEHDEFAEAMQHLFRKNHRNGCKNPKGLAAINMYVIECSWEDVTGKSEHPIRTPEDAVFPDVYSIPEDKKPYDDADLYEKRKDRIRNSSFLGIKETR